MRLAIALSARGLGTTSPNPPVGCVILDHTGRVAGTGYHRRKGEPHAEGYALAQAGRRAAGGTAVVTLEPCNHVGRTPACRQLLLDAGVARVVIAVIDPTSRGDGGAAVMRTAGVDVEVGVLAGEARLVLGPWLAAVTNGRPTVTAIVVASTGTAADSAVRDRILAELRISVDAVLHPDGTVEEGVAGSHGQGVLNLPTTPMTGTPPDVLKVLYAADVRSLLLVGDDGSFEPYASRSLIDRVLTYLPNEAYPTQDQKPVVDGSLLPAGFHVERVTKTAQYTAFESVPLAAVVARLGR